ncbi:MAG: hypothetical protein ACYTG7_14945 [Planctomycetota bacterium]
MHDTENSSKKRWIWFGAAAAAVILCYLPALREIYFIWDGWTWRFCAARWAEDPALLWTLDPSYSFRPLCRALYLGMYLLFDEWAAGYLLVVLVFHLLCALAAGALVRRLTGDDIAAGWTMVLFVVSSSHTETIQWIGSFPHVVLGLELFLIFLLLIPSSEGRARVRIPFAALLLLCAVLTREPWVVLPPLLLILFLWKKGMRWTLSLKGLLPLACTGLLALGYLYVHQDILSGDRVPGGEEVMAFHWDAIPRMLRSLSQVFIPRIFYAQVLRNPWGGILILALLLGASALGSRERLRHAFWAALFVVAALLPFAFYRSYYMSGRYFYLATPFALLLIILATRGMIMLLERIAPGFKFWPVFMHGFLGIVGILSVLGVRLETRDHYLQVWSQSRTVSWYLQRIVAETPEGSWFCVVNLPSPSRAVWESMSRCLAPGADCSFIMASNPQELGEALEEKAGPSGVKRIFRWSPEPLPGGTIKPLKRRIELSDAISDIKPLLEWGWPEDKAQETWSALLIKAPPPR